MIPASYLFKDVFQKTWYDPDTEAAIARSKHGGHRARSWLSPLAALFHRQPAEEPVCKATPVSSRS